MNILEIVQSAALNLDLEIPETVFTNTERTWREMADICNTAALQILAEYDWSKLMKAKTITGDGVASSFSLPVDYDRMVKDANLWSPAIVWYPSQQVQDFNRWIGLQTFPLVEWETRWMVYGGELHVRPILPANTQLTYGYISSHIVGSSGGGAGTQDRFDGDTQTFLLDDELLRLGIIWNWKESKGFDFSADLIKYNQRMESVRFSDVGSRQTIVTGPTRRGGWYGFPGGFA